MTEDNIEVKLVGLEEDTSSIIEKIDIKKKEKTFINPTLDFLPFPNIFVCGPSYDEELLPTNLFQTYELNQIQNLKIQEKICIFKTEDEIGINFSTKVKDLIKPPVRDEGM